MLCIDIIIGPLLTLLVYKTGKKTLKFDLATIIIVQLSMFGYGLHTVAVGRPAWLAFSVDQFYLVRAADIDKTQSPPAAYRTPWLGPQWVAIHLPDDRQQREQLISKTLQAGSGLFMMPSLYAPLSVSATVISKKAQPLTELNNYNTATTVRTTLARWPTARSWLPLWSNPRSMTVLLDEKSNVVAISDLNPWKQ
jgi:hypothetical protein